MSTIISDYAWSGTFGPGADLLFETSYGQVEFVGNAADTNTAVFEQWVHSVSVDGFSAEILTFEQGAHSVSTGRNVDMITAEGYIGTLDTGNGDDIVTFAENAGAGTVSLGIGDDEADFGGWVNEVFGGNGVDTVNFLGHAGASLVDLGNGTGSGTEILTTGGWINEIVQGNGAADVSLEKGAGSVSLGGGADSLLSLGWVSGADMGSGDDAVELEAGGGTVDLDAGDDIFVGIGRVNQVNGGSGRDDIALLGGGRASGGDDEDVFSNDVASTFVYGDGGTDNFNWNFDASQYDFYDGGAGFDNLNIYVNDAAERALVEDALEASGILAVSGASSGPVGNPSASAYINGLNLQIVNVENIVITDGDPPLS